MSSRKKRPRTRGLWRQPHPSTDIRAILPFYVVLPSRPQRGSDLRDKNLYKSYILFTEFNSPPNLVRDKGIYSTRARFILTSAGPAWDLRVQLMEHEGEDQRVQEWELLPIEALCKKATMSAAYAAKKFGFVSAFGFENLRDRAIE